MPQSDLTKLRRRQLNLQRKLVRLEPLVILYRMQLADTEAAIKFISPLAAATPPVRRRGLPFGRGELPRLALAIMREAGGPVPVRAIAAQALAA